MRVTSIRPIFKWFIIPLTLILLTSGVYFLYQTFKGSSVRSRRIIIWIRNPLSNPEWALEALTRCSPTSSFLFPTNGYVGYLWDDSFRPGHNHQGIDIFTSKKSGDTPVYAVYGGFLTRLPEWKSSLIIRIPDDPLLPGRQIWTYYTHMADTNGSSFIVDAFPSGTSELFISEGTLLGYQGNYSGTPGHPVGVHLHFSIVRDDGKGSFLNELKIHNTIDPSAYFGLPLNGRANQDNIPLCPQ